MAESFEEFMAAERELGRQAWARAEAAAMTDEDDLDEAFERIIAAIGALQDHLATYHQAVA